VLRVPVVGVARSDWSDAGFRQHAHDAILASRPDAMAAVIDALCERLDLVAGDYADLATFQTLAETLDRHNSRHAVFYLAIPPSAFPLVIESLEAVGLTKRGRVVVEKPFGRDLASARDLNGILHKSFPEERIFRIDHYLGKESVEDLMVFRFSNALLEPVWSATTCAACR
jgi:glucose-6-phosphate 1-dehydrogenase